MLVRQHGTPYWEVVAGDACVSEDPSGWTMVRVRRPGLIRVRARFSAVGALPQGAALRRRRRARRTGAVNPPVTEK